jgi:hypothetical protein
MNGEKLSDISIRSTRELVDICERNPGKQIVAGLYFCFVCFISFL